MSSSGFTILNFQQTLNNFMWFNLIPKELQRGPDNKKKEAHIRSAFTVITYVFPIESLPYLYRFLFQNPNSKPFKAFGKAVIRVHFG
jgi:hypothetical protein